MFGRTVDPTKIKVNLDDYHIEFRRDGLEISRYITIAINTPNGSRDFSDKDLRKIERVEQAIIGRPKYRLNFNKSSFSLKATTFDSVYLVKCIKRKEGQGLDLKRELQFFEWVFRGN